jgi:hypothetical protein
MGSEDAIEVRWTRAELVAVREAIELTPLFEVRARQTTVPLDLVLGERLARHLVPVDMPTAIAKVKLLRAVRDAHQAETVAPRAADAA